jgi:hypothetical protein
MIAKYSIVLHVANSITVMLGSGSGAIPAQPLKDFSNESTWSVVTNPVYSGGDTITGMAKPGMSTGGASPKNPDYEPGAEEQAMLPEQFQIVQVEDVK